MYGWVFPAKVSFVFDDVSKMKCPCPSLRACQNPSRLEINKHVGDFWFLIDATWMNTWINFVLGKSDPPGYITNLNLFEQVDEASSSSRRECEKNIPPQTSPKLMQGVIGDVLFRYKITTAYHISFYWWMRLHSRLKGN